MQNTFSLPKNKQCPHCGRYDNRAVSVDALIVKDGKILLIKRGVEPYKGFWGLPGGHVDWDETVEEAVSREVKEEVDMKVLDLKLLGVYSSPTRHPRQAVAVSFICGVKGVPIAGDDAIDAKYIHFNELPLPLAFDHEKIIGDFKNKFFKEKLSQEQ